MTLHVFGDSHSMYLSGRVREAKVHHLDSWTMHRVARDGAHTLDDVRVGDDVLFVFGEIDVRRQLVRLNGRASGEWN